MNNSQAEGYNAAFKSTLLFGGVQVVQILVSIIKSKLVSLWLGTTGFGIMGLFNTTISLISSVTNLGLQSSAVKDIAHASAQKDEKAVARIVKAINRWVWWTGSGGALLTILLSPWLSRWVFESSEYTLSFVWLSLVVLLTGLYNAHYAILQGTRHLTLLAKANIFGSLFSFACSIPLFYIFREQGIVWALICTALSTLVVSGFYARKIKLIKVEQTSRESFETGKKTVKLGIAMAMSGVAVLLVQLAVKVFIKHCAGEPNLGNHLVGLYEAGWALNASYLGLVFTAMAKDYFPRLSQKADDNNLIGVMVNQQGEVALLLLAPMIMGMVVFLPWLIRLLYSGTFVDAVPMAKWLLIGSLVKSGSWGISFVFLAKGDGKLFLFNELGIKCITLPLYMAGYSLFGLEGIGYAFALNYVIYFIWVALVARIKYGLSYKGAFWRLFFVLLAALLLFPVGQSLWHAGWLTGLLLLVAVTLYSLVQLNRRMNLKTVWLKIRERYGKK